MTHSGGKPHAVGDRGQRYEVTVFDEGKQARIVFGWTEDELAAHHMGQTAIKRPIWRDYRVRDRLTRAAGSESPTTHNQS